MIKPLNPTVVPNTTTEFEFFDGTKVKMTLTFAALYNLKSKNPAMYKRYCMALTESGKELVDELNNITILYTAYLCANPNEENLLSEEEFMYMCGSDRDEVSKAARVLIRPKKQ